MTKLVISLRKLKRARRFRKSIQPFAFALEGAIDRASAGCHLGDSHAHAASTWSADDETAAMRVHWRRLRRGAERRGYCRDDCGRRARGKVAPETPARDGVPLMRGSRVCAREHRQRDARWRRVGRPRVGRMFDRLRARRSLGTSSVGPGPARPAHPGHRRGGAPRWLATWNLRPVRRWGAFRRKLGPRHAAGADPSPGRKLPRRNRSGQLGPVRPRV